jgi:hypothetical protein
MNVRLRHLVATFGWRQWLLCAVLAIAVVAAGLFAVRTVRYTVYWREHREAPIERWMPVAYVARSYGVPDEVLWDALGPPAPRAAGFDRRPLSEVAAERGLTFEEARARLEQAIAATKPSRHPQQPPGRPGP